MEITSLIIEGAKQESLIDALHNEYSIDHVYSTDKISILYLQKFYLRVSSNLLTSIILDFTDRHRCMVEIVSGGGGSGIFSITLGSEGNINKKIVESLHRICESNAWGLIEQ